MNSVDFELFKGTSLSDIMKDIYHNSKRKSREIEQLIQTLTPMVKNVADASIIVPLIKEYLEVSVKNDDALIKLASIVQRLITGNRIGGSDDPSDLLSDDERRRLIQEATDELSSIKDQQQAEVIPTVKYEGK